MIKRAHEMDVKFVENMRGGTGTVSIIHAVNQGEYKGKSRLIGKILLEPGCSIGRHVHENEEEIFYVLKGTAVFYDNDTRVILHEGDSALTSDGQGHAIANESDQPLEIMAVILTY